MTEQPETVVRAFELPVQSLSTESRTLLVECWRQAAMLANWGADRLRAADISRTPDMERLPPMPPVDLYSSFTGIARQAKKGPRTAPVRTGPGYIGQDFFAGAKGSAQAILRGVWEEYREDRIDVVWRLRRSHRTYKIPQNWPVTGQMWREARLDDNGRPVVRFALPGGMAELTLRGGPEFGRQIALFRQVVKGELPRLELTIRWQRSSESCHRPVCYLAGVPGRVMVKMVARVPVKKRTGDRTLVLLTDPQAFWVAELDGRRAWVLNADHVRRGVGRHEEHLRRLQRMSEDAKAERRLHSNRAAQQQVRLESLCYKDHNRLSSWTHETAAHLIGFCVRQGVGEIFYLDRDRGFIPRFEWRGLHDKLADKAKAQGIAFYSESGAGMVADPAADSMEPGDVDIRTNNGDGQWERSTQSRVTALGNLLAGRRRGGSHPAVSAVPVISTT